MGYFKGSVKMYPLPDDGSTQPEMILTNIPSADPIDVVVRVYVIKVRFYYFRLFVKTQFFVRPLIFNRKIPMVSQILT